jgi:hypothetical protein
MGATSNKDYAVAIDELYDFDLNDPTDIYFSKMMKKWNWRENSVR